MESNQILLRLWSVRGDSPNSLREKVLNKQGTKCGSSSVLRPDLVRQGSHNRLDGQANHQPRREGSTEPEGVRKEERFVPTGPQKSTDTQILLAQKTGIWGPGSSVLPLLNPYPYDIEENEVTRVG